MPRGSAPGERRGGRKKGTPDKATAARQAAMQAAVADCFATMTAAEVEALTPKQVLLLAMQAAVRNGDVLLAVNIAERAAPYYDAKITKAEVATRDLTLEEMVQRSYDGTKAMAGALAVPAPRERAQDIAASVKPSPPTTAERFVAPSIHNPPVSANPGWSRPN